MRLLKGIKHKWVCWGIKGLGNLFNILFVRYCNERVYGELKERYLSPRSTTIQIAIT